MSRSYILMLMGYFAVICYYYRLIDLKKIILIFFPIIVLILYFINTFGYFINAVRSYSEIGKYEKGLELSYKDFKNREEKK